LIRKKTETTKGVTYVGWLSESLTCSRRPFHTPLHNLIEERYSAAMRTSSHDPITSAVPAEVPLPDAPLVRVIAQVRFPQVLSIEKRDFVAPFQETIRTQYPILRAEQMQGMRIGPEGASPIPPQAIWRFTDAEGNWKVSLAQDFVAIETTAYESRNNFFERFETITQALAEHVAPRVVDRIGIRYIDRVTGDAMKEITKLVRPEILGILATAVVEHASHTISESVFNVPKSAAQLLARWGLLPKGGTVDPAIEPLAEPSWILDLDMFRAETRTFDPSEVVADARSYAERIYTFFRWAVTDDFLRLYGGKV
jgi:uncharacterized protein (TIGR04255 family)